MEPTEQESANSVDLEKSVEEQNPSDQVYRTKSTRSAKSIPTTALDWDGPDDPENPFNWPLWKRVYQTIGTGLLAFAV